MNNIHQVFIEDRTGEYYYLGLTDGKTRFTYGTKKGSMGIGGIKKTFSRNNTEESFVVTCCDLNTLYGMPKETKYKINKIVKDKSGKYKKSTEEIEVKENFDIIKVGGLYKKCNVFLRNMSSDNYSVCKDSTLQRISEDKYKVLMY